MTRPTKLEVDTALRAVREMSNPLREPSHADVLAAEVDWLRERMRVHLEAARDQMVERVIQDFDLMSNMVDRNNQ